MTAAVAVEALWVVWAAADTMSAEDVAAVLELVAVGLPGDVFVGYCRLVHMGGKAVEQWACHPYCCCVCRTSCACSSLC